MYFRFLRRLLNSNLLLTYDVDTLVQVLRTALANELTVDAINIAGYVNSLDRLDSVETGSVEYDVFISRVAELLSQLICTQV